MQPHYSHPSHENATQSSRTSLLASYKEVPPPPPLGKKDILDYINVTLESILGDPEGISQVRNFFLTQLTMPGLLGCLES